MSFEQYSYSAGSVKDHLCAAEDHRCAAKDDLSPDQLAAFEAVKHGDNLFLTGPGGTGKSFFIRKVYRWALSRGTKVQVCALTGTAAQLLDCDAQTLHRWAGIGLGGDGMIKRVFKTQSALKRWRTVELLIVDEVSMLDANLFDNLNALAQAVRGNSKPFGGVQLVFSGDFCQLPPVGEASGFCFESAAWSSMFPATVVLTTMHRQKDPAFCKILTEIRNGRLTKSSYNTLLTRVCDVPPPNITRIVPTRKKADAINSEEYAKLASAEVEFEMKEYISPKNKLTPAVDVAREVAALKERAPATVRLKAGAVVMATQNIDDFICNGSQGVVVGFGAAGSPSVQFKNGCRRTMSPVFIESEKMPGVAVAQIPLQYAWAMTIHKAQGATLDCAVLDVGRDIFEDGQTYVALSRLRSLEDLWLTTFDPTKITLNLKARQFYSRAAETAE